MLFLLLFSCQLLVIDKLGVVTQYHRTVLAASLRHCHYLLRCQYKMWYGMVIIVDRCLKLLFHNSWLYWFTTPVLGVHIQHRGGRVFFSLSSRIRLIPYGLYAAFILNCLWLESYTDNVRKDCFKKKKKKVECRCQTTKLMNLFYVHTHTAVSFFFFFF